MHGHRRHIPQQHQCFHRAFVCRLLVQGHTDISRHSTTSGGSCTTSICQSRIVSRNSICLSFRWSQKHYNVHRNHRSNSSNNNGIRRPKYETVQVLSSASGYHRSNQGRIQGGAVGAAAPPLNGKYSISPSKKKQLFLALRTPLKKFACCTAPP